MKIGKLATEASSEASASAKVKKVKAGKAETAKRPETTASGGRKIPGMTSLILDPAHMPKLKQLALDFQVNHGSVVTISAIVRSAVEAILLSGDEITRSCANEVELRKYLVERIRG
jgi:hypothetical protein